jgi:hypothetical protein
MRQIIGIDSPKTGRLGARVSKPSFVLMSVFSELLLAFVRRNLPQFAFSSAGHFDSPRALQPIKINPVLSGSFISMEQKKRMVKGYYPLINNSHF